MTAAVVTGTVVIAIIGVLALKFRLGRGYSTLFTGLSQEEAQQVVTLLSEQGVNYRFNNREGAIRISSVNVNQIRTEFLSMGYSKSGFSHDTCRNNTGLMTVESDKKQYTLYELQDRFGVRICLFDGVQDVKVTTTEAEEPVYACRGNTEVGASASVVVTMMSGRSLPDSGAATIKNLITTPVGEMNFTNIAMFDADTMVEVGGRSNNEDYGSTKDVTALTNLVESSMTANARRVLEKLYGQGETAVSVRDALNMEKLIQGNIRYTAPEKIDEQDKIGLLCKEDATDENSGAAAPGSGGIVGADANADTPGYINQNDVQISTDPYANSSAAREWPYDSVKEQRQVDPGVLENTTIGIMIGAGDTSVSIQDLINLVTDSAGISRGEARQEITIIRALSSSGQAATQPVAAALAQTQARSFPLPVIIAAIAGGILILLLFVLLLVRRKQKKGDSSDDAELAVESAPEEKFPDAPATETELDTQYRDEETGKNEQILNLRTQHSLKLEQNIGKFVDQNPQITAKLMQSWLGGEGDLDGRKRIGKSSSK